MFSNLPQSWLKCRKRVVRYPGCQRFSKRRAEKRREERRGEEEEEALRSEIDQIIRYVPLIYAFQIPEDIDQSPFSVQRVNLMAILNQITILTRYVSLFPSSSKTSGLSVCTVTN